MIADDWQIRNVNDTRGYYREVVVHDEYIQLTKEQGLLHLAADNLGLPPEYQVVIKGIPDNHDDLTKRFGQEKIVCNCPCYLEVTYHGGDTRPDVSASKYHEGFDRLIRTPNGKVIFYIKGTKKIPVLTDMKICYDLGLKAKGKKFVWPNGDSQNIDYYYNCLSRGPLEFKYNVSSLQEFTSEHNETKDWNLDTWNNFLVATLASHYRGLESKTKMPCEAVTKVITKLRPFIKPLLLEQPVLYCHLKSFVEMTKLTIDNVRISGVFNSRFERVETYDELVANLKELVVSKNGYISQKFRDTIASLPEYAEHREKTKDSTTVFRKLMDDFDKLGIDEEKYPQFSQVIRSGVLPIGAFKDGDRTFNDNWSLWEKMLTSHEDVTIELAEVVAKRDSHSRDLMSYFYFVSNSLPTWLRRYTDDRYDCVPVIVGNIENQSASLTPTLVQSEEGRKVFVPFASIKGPMGNSYIRDCNLVLDGYSYRGYAAENDIAKDIDSEEDFGLFYYTFSDEQIAVFLIGRDGKKINFYRVPPAIKSNGDYEAIYKWVDLSYKWINHGYSHNQIAFRFNDLLFVKSEPIGKRSKQVFACGDYKFSKPVKFWSSTKESPAGCIGHIASNNGILIMKGVGHYLPAGHYTVFHRRIWGVESNVVWDFSGKESGKEGDGSP